MLYGRMGGQVQLLRMATLADVKALDKREPDKHDEERIAIGYLMVGKFLANSCSFEERIFDLAYLKADGGIREIHDAAKAAGSTLKSY